MYSKFDENGIPTHDIEGKELEDVIIWELIVIFKLESEESFEARMAFIKKVVWKVFVKVKMSKKTGKNKKNKKIK